MQKSSKAGALDREISPSVRKVRATLALGPDAIPKLKKQISAQIPAIIDKSITKSVIPYSR